MILQSTSIEWETKINGLLTQSYGLAVLSYLCYNNSANEEIIPLEKYSYGHLTSEATEMAELWRLCP